MTIATTFPDRDALLQTARDLRAHGRPGDALAVLARLQALYPGFSRLYQERGHCHVQLRDAPAAIAALHEAVRLNPTLPASWDMLEQLYRLRGDATQAATAARQLALLKQLPEAVVVANSLYADGDLSPAEDVLRDYLEADPGNVGALRLLARIRMAHEAFAEAEALLAAVVAQAPDYDAARFDYAMALLQQQKHDRARQEIIRLLAEEPDNRDYLKAYGAACIGLGDHEPVIDLYQGLLAGQGAMGPEVADLRLWRANALKVTGRAAKAIADYRASLMARPDNGAAWFSLANLKTHAFSDDELERLQAAEARPGIQDSGIQDSGIQDSGIQDMDRAYLCFALGKALEDRGDYAASWRYYERGNAVRRLASRYRPEGAEASAARLKEVFTHEFFAARAGWGETDTAPIFIVGLPRSGSTLVEQILASHALVEGTQELAAIGRYAGELCGRDADCGLPLHPEAVLGLDAAACRALGQRFLAETQVYRRLGRPFFIDKMPNNMWHVGLIHLILPRAVIIDVRREPMACGFSNLKQLFGTNHQEFTYDMNALGRYYRTYLDLMRHWDDVLPGDAAGRVLRVAYEDLVDDLEGGVRRLLARAGLPFDPACLNFHQTRRSIRTPSSEQVRQPIGRDGLTQWRHYAPWLDPLRDALGDAVTSYKAGNKD